jgi:DNA topoisomerase-1
MAKYLVIVESAGKIKKIGEYLGPDYIVKASFGHCMDLDPKTLSIDIENNYNPNYIVSEGKHKIVKELQELAAKSEVVILAADNDREGEAIAWSLSNILNLKNPKRIIFTEITKKAILHAVDNPTQIDMNMVYAQQARRLLDRLVGYKLSPILQTNLNDKNAKSAGRVQSVVVKIINDKETEIKNSISTSYLKTICDLEFNKDKINCILTKHFESLETGKHFLNLINKKSIFKVIDIQNKISIRKPSAPFITSSLQQEASTKLKFSVKKTMEVAQKLYEGGFITYMRTDSTNLSQEAITDCKIYILQKYGEIYSNPTNYSSSKNAQEAHEAIRPCNLKLAEINIIDKDQVKLYNLIWKKTISSQMSHAKINIQSINIDTLNNDISILVNCTWISTYLTTIFDGFLILYDDSTSEDSDDTNQGKIEIKINDTLNFNKVKMSEEFNKLPLRFNEANLVKYLEKNNIGRPSTYASVINIILERKYVEIKDIEGFIKTSNVIELDKKYKLKEVIKDVVIGKENKKIVPTELGITITTFLEKNFNEIMQINFTAQFETYLDKIAENKAKWFNVLDIFYKKFSTNVEKLNKNKFNNSDRLLGIDPISKKELYIGSGKYGSYIKVLEDDKFKYISIENDSITIEDAIELSAYPKLLGKIDKQDVELMNGKFGLYIKFNKNNYPILSNEDIDLEKAKEIIENKNNNENKDKSYCKNFTIKDKIISVKNGQYGYYLQINGKNKSQNISIPKDINIENINIKKVLEIIANKNGTIKKNI